MTELVQSFLDPGKLPHHLAIIMDGNGRWAKKQGLKRIAGHKRGVDSVRDIVRACRELGIKVLTLYAFSQENWKRPATEVKALMTLLSEYLKRELEEMLSNGIALHTIGDIGKLPGPVRDILLRTIENTANNKEMILNLALSYGGRDEITRAVRRIADQVQGGSLKPEDIDQSVISNALDSSGLPDPDLLIRTSGEFRISNFLLWQMAYTEIYVTEVLWPDFRRDHLFTALMDYQKRERRFGRTSEQLRASQ